MSPLDNQLINLDNRIKPSAYKPLAFTDADAPLPKVGLLWAPDNNIHRGIDQGLCQWIAAIDHHSFCPPKDLVLGEMVLWHRPMSVEVIRRYVEDRCDIQIKGLTTL